MPDHFPIFFVPAKQVEDGASGRHSDIVLDVAEADPPAVAICRTGNGWGLLAELFLCPSPWQLYCMVSFSIRSHMRLQFCCMTWTALYLAQLEASRMYYQEAMSDSSVEERPPASRPAGPPPPLPEPAQQDAAHRVAHELGFRGEALCYIPWDINSMSRLVISLRGMRPHEREHPNVLVCRDSRPAEAEWEAAEADDVEEADEASEEAGHVSSEHGEDARTAYELRIQRWQQLPECPLSPLCRLQTSIGMFGRPHRLKSGPPGSTRSSTRWRLKAGPS